MKTFKDLNADEKQKFTAYLTFKAMMRTEFQISCITAFFVLLIGLFLSVSIAIIGLNFFNAGIGLASQSLINTGFNVIQMSTFMGFIFAFIFVIVLVLAYYTKQQDDRLLYNIFEINDVTKDMMEINREDIKKVRFGFRKVK